MSSDLPAGDGAIGEGPSEGDLPAGDGPSGGGPSAGESSGGQPSGQPRRSGLRNPVAAARGLGAATLGLEALVLVLAIQPIRMLGEGFGPAAMAASAGLAVGAVAIAGLLRHRWAWYAGTALQALVLLAGLLHWSLLGVGVVFAVVWAYVWHVRRVILS